MGSVDCRETTIVILGSSILYIYSIHSIEKSQAVVWGADTLNEAGGVSIPMIQTVRTARPRNGYLVVVTDDRFGDGAALERSILEPAGCEVGVASCKTAQDVIEAGRNADGLLVNLAPLSAEAIGGPCSLSRHLALRHRSRQCGYRRRGGPMASRCATCRVTATLKWPSTR